jgi:SMC interacting uncharacterized protein involved in chromosome segregation
LLWNNQLRLDGLKAELFQRRLKMWDSIDMSNAIPVMEQVIVDLKEQIEEGGMDEAQLADLKTELFQLRKETSDARINCQDIKNMDKTILKLEQEIEEVGADTAKLEAAWAIGALRAERDKAFPNEFLVESYKQLLVSRSVGASTGNAVFVT